MNDKLEAKEAKSLFVIRSNIIQHGPSVMCVAFSGGKDSMVTADLVRRANGGKHLPLVWCDTKNEHPETYRFIKQLKEEGYPIVRVASDPGVNFWTIAKENGLPEIRGKGKAREPKCCQLLKNKPAEQYYKANGIEAVFVGLSMFDSHQRFMLIQRNANKAKAEGVVDDPCGRDCGMVYYGKTKDRYTILPIAHFTENEIIEYHEKYNLPHCKVYDLPGGFKGNRVGCNACTAYKNWESRMIYQNPNAYSRIQKEFLTEDE